MWRKHSFSMLRMMYVGDRALVRTNEPKGRITTESTEHTENYWTTNWGTEPYSIPISVLKIWKMSKWHLWDGIFIEKLKFFDRFFLWYLTLIFSTSIYMVLKSTEFHFSVVIRPLNESLNEKKNKRTNEWTKRER